MTSAMISGEVGGVNRPLSPTPLPPKWKATVILVIEYDIILCSYVASLWVST